VTEATRIINTQWGVITVATAVADCVTEATRNINTQWGDMWTTG
jgi:hypothetical protein